jgi:hypothetical protein
MQLFVYEGGGQQVLIILKTIILGEFGRQFIHCSRDCKFYINKAVN